MKSRFPQFPRSLCIALLMALEIPACFADYNFTRLYAASPAVKEDTLSSSSVAINKAGAVAFVGLTPGQLFSPRVLLLSRGPGNVTQLPLPDNTNSIHVTSVNSSGTVAFVASLFDGTVGVYTSSGAGVVQIAVSANFPGALPLEFNYADPTINDRGDVAFLSSSFMSPSRIMMKSGGQMKVIADLGTNNSIPLIGNVNSAGVVPYIVQTGFFSPAEYTIYAQSESSRSLITKGTAGRYKGAAINDQGLVVFGQLRNTVGSPVFSGSGGAIKTIVDDPTLFVASHISMNNSGAILMRVTALSSSPYDALMTGPNFPKDKVISMGDPLFGSTVTGFYADEDQEGHTLNDNGQIAFRYKLANGETGVAIATPGGANPTSVNSASFAANQPLAQDSIGTILGFNLSTGTQGGLASTLGGSTVSLTDSKGVTRPAQLFFVSPGQINFLVPLGTAMGPASVNVASADGTVSIGFLTIAAVAPGIYPLTAGGLAAANILRVRNGTQTYESVYQVSGSAVLPLPIDLGPGGTDQVYLLLYGTGLRHGASTSVVINGSSVPVLFAGANSDFVGLDQINVGPLPRTLIGSGSVDVVVKTDGIFANVTNVTIK